jgi:hypothetical protein
MKTFAEIKDGLVVNMSVWEAETPQGDQFVDATGIENVGIGWSYAEGQFIEPVPTAPVGLDTDIPVTEG